MRARRSALFSLAVILALAERAGAEPLTFSNQIVRLFQQHCQACHRPNGGAPFSLITYRDAYPWRTQIRRLR